MGHKNAPFHIVTLKKKGWDDFTQEKLGGDFCVQSMILRWPKISHSRMVHKILVVTAPERPNKSFFMHSAISAKIICTKKQSMLSYATIRPILTTNSLDNLIHRTTFEEPRPNPGTITTHQREFKKKSSTHPQIEGCSKNWVLNAATSNHQLRGSRVLNPTARTVYSFLLRVSVMREDWSITSPRGRTSLPPYVW